METDYTAVKVEMTEDERAADVDQVADNDIAVNEEMVADVYGADIEAYIAAVVDGEVEIDVDGATDWMLKTSQLKRKLILVLLLTLP